MAYANVEDKRAYQRRHYELNKDKYKATAKAFTERNRVKIRAYIRDYLAKHPCVDCGEGDIIVLDFDHVRGKKKFSIGESVSSGYSLATMIKEIEKCDIRCANCHRRKTHRERIAAKEKGNPAVS